MTGKPSMVSVKLILDNGKEMAIVSNVNGDDDVRKSAPVAAPLLLEWMREGNKVDWEFEPA